MRRSGAALAYGRWAIRPLVQAWHTEGALLKKASVTAYGLQSVQGQRRQTCAGP